VQNVNNRLYLPLALLGAAALVLLWKPAAHREDPPVQETHPAPARRAEALVTVYVAGAVRAPGLYSVPEGSRTIAAIKAAGGATAEAQPGGVNLAELLEDGQEVLVPDRSSAASARGGRHARGHAHGRHARVKRRRHAQPAPAAALDLNRAGASALANVPGISPSLADRIVAFRDANGPFDRIDDLLDVEGMSRSKLDRAEPYLLVTAP
jgi:competence protein ComEA